MILPIESWIQVGFSIGWKCCIQAGDTYVSRQLEGCLQEEERTAHEETEETEETARQVVGILRFLYLAPPVVLEFFSRRV